jgi:DNA repair ATPase RecN
MKNNIHKVYGKLPKNKLVLSKKLKLSIASDLEDAYDEYKDILLDHDIALEILTNSTIAVREAQSQLDYDEDNENEVFEKLTNSQNKVSEILGNLETKVGELGFAPSDLFPDYQKLVYDLDRLDEQSQKRYTI